MFDKFDENKDNFLSKAEMAVLIKKVFKQRESQGFDPSKVELKTVKDTEP